MQFGGAYASKHQDNSPFFNSERTTPDDRFKSGEFRALCHHPLPPLPGHIQLPPRHESNETLNGTSNVSNMSTIKAANYTKLYYAKRGRRNALEKLVANITTSSDPNMKKLKQAVKNQKNTDLKKLNRTNGTLSRVVSHDSSVPWRAPVKAEPLPDAQRAAWSHNLFLAKEDMEPGKMLKDAFKHEPNFRDSGPSQGRLYRSMDVIRHLKNKPAIRFHRLCGGGPGPNSAMVAQLIARASVPHLTGEEGIFQSGVQTPIFAHLL